MLHCIKGAETGSRLRISWLLLLLLLKVSLTPCFGAELVLSLVLVVGDMTDPD